MGNRGSCTKQCNPWWVWQACSSCQARNKGGGNGRHPAWELGNTENNSQVWYTGLAENKER